MNSPATSQKSPDVIPEASIPGLPPVDVGNSPVDIASNGHLPLATPSKSAQLDTAQVRTEVQQRCDSIRNKILEVIGLFPKDMKDELTRLAGDAIACRQACFEMRLDQIETLRAGQWDIYPEIELSPLIDFMNDQYLNLGRAAHKTWETFLDALRSTLPEARKISPAVDSAVGKTILDAKLEFGELLRLIRNPYNKLETEILKQHGISEVSASVMEFLYEHVQVNDMLWEIARSFNAREDDKPARKKIAGASPSSGNTVGLAKSHSGGAEFQMLGLRVRRFDLSGRMSPRLAEVFVQCDFTPDEIRTSLDAYKLGLNIIDTLSLQPNPSRDWLKKEHELFLRGINRVLNAIADQSKRQALGHLFAPLALAVGVLDRYNEKPKADNDTIVRADN